MKKFATFSYITFLFLCLPFLKAEAQTLEMVVNEYYNESFPSQEWSELLVVSNGTNLGINLSDYVYTDNNASQTTWQGGVIFKSIPLWQNVKEGTVIVIWHRDLPTGITRDINIADGYIEVSRNDREIFDEFLQSGGDYDEVALNIAADGDILQIRNSSTGNSVAAHVHALGHKTTPGSAYTILFNANKPIINTLSNCSDGSSNSVIPGRTIADYSGANKAQIVSGSNVTKGLPNKNTQYPLTNYQFWEELREPEWPSANSLQSTYSPTGIKLTWTPLANASSIEGYVILRAKSFPATLPNFDGYIFRKGDPFPSNPNITVVDTLTATATTYTENFTSSFELPCGEFFEYRIYPYRYGKDNQNKDNTIVPFSARGRSYNEDQFARVTVSRPAFPAPPQITTFGGGAIFVFCEGQNLTLFANPSTATSYQWLKDGTAIAGATGNTYNAVSEGRYAVRAFNAEGCAEQSAEVMVVKSAIPEAQIIPSTDIKLCSSDDTTLTASPDLPGYTYQWLDGAGTPIANENNVRFKTDKPGSYRVIVTSDAGCSDTSAPTVIRLFEPSISLKTADIGIPVETLEFGKLGECESSKELSVVFETESADAFIVILTAPDGFSVSPTTFTLSRSGPQVVKVTFSPLESKIYSSFLNVKVDGDCSFTDRYRLTGEKANVNVAALKSSIDYPVMASCDAQKVTEIVQIVNSSTDDAVTFLDPVVQAPFTVIAPTFPRPVLKGDTLTITVEYTPTPGLSSKILTLPYTSAACTSSVNISLTANTIQPSITSAVGEVDFKNLEGCTKAKDTTISVTNATDYPLTIPVQQLNANFFVVQAVSLAARETQSVRLRFTPSTAGQITSTVLLKADKCPEIANISLVLKGSSGAPAIQSIPEYEAISNCTPAFKTIQSKVTTTSPVTIENITVPAGFTVSGIDVGQVVNGVQPFDITFAPPADGVYDEVLSVQFSGCPEPNTIPLKGKKSTLNFGFKETEIDFGTVQPNSTVPPQTATLVNTGNDSVTVDKIDPPAPFKIVSTSLPLPARLAPGQEMSITFEYAPTQEKSDSHAAAFEACLGQKTILLKGLAQYPAGTGKAVVSLPVLRGAPGSVIEIPVIIANEANSFALEKAAIREISIRLTYDPMLLMPQSVRIANGTQGFDQATITELSPGTAELLLKSTGGSVITPGTAAIISAKVLLGSNTSTSIVFSNITPVGNSIVVFTQQDGEFILDDSCSAGRRIGGFSGQFMLRVAGVVPVMDDKAEITFETGADEILSLELYNSFGQRVKTIFKGTVQAGQYANEISLHDLANGAYHIIMQTPTNIATAKLVIAR